MVKFEWDKKKKDPTKDQRRKTERHTTTRIYKDPMWWVHPEDPGELLSGGVLMSQSQVQSIREFVGLPLAWIREYSWTKEEFFENLTPFFNGKPQLNRESYKYIAARLRQGRFVSITYWDDSVVSEREDIQKAIKKCIRGTAFNIGIGRIKFDKKEIFKLKVHPGFPPCKEILYQYLKLFSKTQKNGWSSGQDGEDAYDEFVGCINTFLEEFEKSIKNDITINWNILKTDPNNNKILESITNVIKPPDRRLLDGKVSKLQSGKFQFNDVEGQYLEYKQSMFSPDLKKIKPLAEPGTDPHKRQVRALNDSLIDEILSTVCAFLNTNDGVLYIGVDDKSRQIVGLSDDRNSDVFKTKKKSGEFKYPLYTEFQEKYKIKILQLMGKRINNFDQSYVEDIRYLVPGYGKDDNGDNIDVLCIPCKKIPSDKPLVYLRILDKDGKIREEVNGKLYKRVDESDIPIPEKDQIRFLMQKQRKWAKHEFQLDDSL